MDAPGFRDLMQRVLAEHTAPLPFAGAVCSARTASARKKAVRAALLRWHPDKFDLSKFTTEDRDAVADAVADVTRRVVKEKKRLAR